MSVILSIETSTMGCSVAVHNNGELVTSNDLLTEKSSAELLTTLIDQSLSNAKITYADLNGVAVAKGPGSYTGLRIGVSTAKGLCLALDLPLLSYNTLLGLTTQVQQTNTLLCPMLDARRQEVYTLLIDKEEVVMDTNAMVLDENSFVEFLDRGKVLFFGEGAEKFKSLSKHENAIFLEQIIRPSAKTVGQLVFKKFELKEFEDLVEFEPYYLKEFLAIKAKKILPI